jgi:hypothetical protein
MHRSGIVGAGSLRYILPMKLSRRVKKVLGVAVVAFVLIGITGFFILPPIIKTQAEKRLSAELGRSVSIGKVRVNPYLFSLTIEDFNIQEKDGQNSFLGWRRLYVRFDALLSLAGDWVLGAIELDGFHSGVTVNSDGSFNFSDLLAKFAPPHGAAPAKAGRPIRIGQLSVVDAKVDFNDHSLRHPFRSVVGPLTFTLKGFRTVGATGAEYHFDATTEAGENLSWSGTIVADPFKSHGKFEVGSLVIKKYSPYFEGLSRANVTDGTMGLIGTYDVNLDPSARTMALSDTEMHLRNLKVAERSTGKAAFDLGSLDIAGINADAVALKASVGTVTLAGGRVAVRRNADGTINLITMLEADEKLPAPRAAGPNPQPIATPQLSVGEVLVNGFNVEVDDEAISHHAQLSISDLKLSLKNLSLADGAAMPVSLSFEWAPKGAVQVDGALTLKPTVMADLKTKVDGLAVLPFSPYLEQFFNARITQGTFSTSSSIHASMAGGVPAVALAGDISVDGFGLVDGAHDQDLLGFSRVAVSGLDAANVPRVTASIKQVDIVGPYIRARVNADKTINLASIMGAGAPGPSAAAAAARPAPKIEVGRVTVEGGEFSFTDKSIEPNVAMSMSKFGGSISGLSSENLTRADVDLKGLIGGTGPVVISGKLDPLGARKFVGLKIDVRNVDLLPLSPYSGKFAGYELARGQLVVDSKILVDGEKMDTTNVVTLNQFTFGTASPNPDATGLPVRLGVALLKDVDGKIVIDLPVQGTLGDPNFRIGKVVLRVIVNLLTKAAVSPFSLVGSMFGGGGEELAFQDFEPGSAELEPTELPKLETLSKALANRPALSLGLEGSYDAAADTYALKRRMLADQVRRKIWEELHTADPNIPAPDKLTISAQEDSAMVKKLYDIKFPPGTQFGTPLPPPPVVAAPPMGPPPGFFVRLVDFLTFKKQRRERAARKLAEQNAAEHAKAVAIAVATGLPMDQMSGRLAESIEVTRDDLRALASARAQSVRDRLATSGHISVDRLFLSQGTDSGKENKGPRVLLTLQ